MLEFQTKYLKIIRSKLNVACIPFWWRYFLIYGHTYAGVHFWFSSVSSISKYFYFFPLICYIIFIIYYYFNYCIAFIIYIIYYF